MKLNAGWLPASDAPSALLADVVVPRVSVGTKHDAAGAVFSTRIEEYTWAATQLDFWPRGRLLDAGAGFNPEIHVMSYIAANLGYDVTALDANASALHDMPPHAHVHRELGDLCVLPFEQESFDVWLCISVIEHMLEAEKALALYEAHRVLQRGGIALLTTDETAPEVLTDLFESAGFLTGPILNFNGGQHLTPRVSWIVAQKPF